LTLGELLLFCGLMLGRESRFNFAFDIGIPISLALLLLAAGKDEGASHNDNHKSLHGSVRL
jgi:hypothetical protein